MKYPFKIESNFNTIFLTTINEEGVTEYETIKNFKPYFYSSDKDSFMLPIEESDKQIVEKAWKVKEEAGKFKYTYQADYKIDKTYLFHNYKGVTFEKAPSKIRVGIIDIENYIDGRISIEGKQPLTAISIHENITNNIYTFAWHETKTWKDKENHIFVYSTEKEMIDNFIKFMKKCQFHIITGWNFCERPVKKKGKNMKKQAGYDMPYICNRLNDMNLATELSPFGMTQKLYNSDSWQIYGISSIDYLGLFEKYYRGTMSSYALNEVAEEVLEIKKIEFDGDLNQLWKNDVEKFIEYNRRDVELVKLIDDKYKYMDLVIELKNLCLINVEEMLYNSIIIDALFTSKLNSMGTLVKTKSYAASDGDESLEGAFVKEPIAGIYEWIIDNDAESLYPTIIMNLNISPETKVGRIMNWRNVSSDVNGYLLSDIKDDVVLQVQVLEKTLNFTKSRLNEFLNKYNLVLSGAGTLFRKDKVGVFPEIEEWLFADRKKYKNLQIEAGKNVNKNIDIELNKQNVRLYKIKQEAYKTILNSIYGYLGLKGSRFFDGDLAESVTMSGHKLIKYAIKNAEEKGYEVITTDTDSILCVNKTNPFTNVEDARQGGLELGEYIDKNMQAFVKQEFNADKSRLHFKQEMVAKRGIFQSMKHYALWLVNNEGITKDEIEYKGIEIKRNDTPKFAKKFLKQMYEVLIRENDFEKVNNIIQTFREALRTISVDEIGLPTTIYEKGSYKTIGENLRGSFVWEDNYAKTTLKSFKDIGKGKYYYMKEFPKGIKISSEAKGDKCVITIPTGGIFPKELLDYIDYAAMENKIVDMKVENILNIIETEKSKKEAIDFVQQGLKEDEVMLMLYERVKDIKFGSRKTETMLEDYNEINFANMRWLEYQRLMNTSNNNMFSDFVLAKAIEKKSEKGLFQ